MRNEAGLRYYTYTLDHPLFRSQVEMGHAMTIRLSKDDQNRERLLVPAVAALEWICQPVSLG